MSDIWGAGFKIEDMNMKMKDKVFNVTVDLL